MERAFGISPHQNVGADYVKRMFADSIVILETEVSDQIFAPEMTQRVL